MKALIFGLGMIGLLLSAGCDSSVQDTHGSGGSGSGGSTAADDTCTADDNIAPPSHCGLSYDAGIEELIVTAVTATSMNLETLGAEAVSLLWEGPDLTALFSVGEHVVASAGPSNWDVIVGDQYSVATYYGTYFGGGADLTLVPAPFNVLTFSYALQCSYGSDYWALVAKSSEGEVTVKCHETGKLGAFDVHNAGHVTTSAQGEWFYTQSMTLVVPNAAPQ